MSPELKISDENLTTHQINQQIKTALQEQKNRIIIENNEKLDSIAVGNPSGIEFQLKGEFGDFIGALNEGSRIEIEGNTARFLGNNMTAGEIILEGSASDGAGYGMYGGHLLIKGDAGNSLAELNKGGVIIVQGDIGSQAGMFMLQGDIIILGNASTETGNWMLGGNIYITGEVESLGRNAVFMDMDEEDKAKITEILNAHHLEFDLDAFKKIDIQSKRPFYGH